ncbi:MAG: hypothetical protein KDM81_02735 [Verrucomicrobiae bacterium]|nr:hypothetical protein [Verrucomicrobiae bacterium]
MTKRQPPSIRPAALTLLLLLVLATLFFGWLRPMVQQSRTLDDSLTNLWHQVLLTNSAFVACAGVTPDNVETRREAMNRTQDEIGDARKLIDARIALPTNVIERLENVWQLHDYQNEVQITADRLSAAARAAHVTFSPGVTAGLPQYSAEMANPRLLWPRLFLSSQVLLTPLECKVSEVRVLRQLPSPENSDPGQIPAYVELPVHLELAGSVDSLVRFLTCLPLRGESFDAVGLPVVLTNKPSFFINRILARKAAPNAPELVNLEIGVSGFVPTPRPPPEDD